MLLTATMTPAPPTHSQHQSGKLDSRRMTRIYQKVLLAWRTGAYRRTILLVILLTLLVCAWLLFGGHHGSEMSSLGGSVFSKAKIRGPLSPSTAIYLWCRKGMEFEFRNYLSVRSVLRHFRPKKIIFYHVGLPSVDRWLYNTWFNDLQTELGQGLHLEQMSETVCASSVKMKEFVMKALIGSGGLYVGNSTMVTPAVDAMSTGSNDMLMNLGDDMQGFIFVPRSLTSGSRKDVTSVPIKYLKTILKHCSPLVNIRENLDLTADTWCVMLHPGLKIYPRDVMQLDNKFGALARKSVYGRTERLAPAQSNSSLVPKLAHIWWVGGKPISFLCYLSILSHLFVVEVDNVYVYGNKPPSGEYWKRLRKYPKVQYIHHNRINQYNGVAISSPSLQSDVFRAKVMVEKGGIYTDVDALFVQPIDDLRGYDAVASLDILAEKGMYPEYLNLGVTLGKKGAPFWTKLLKGMNNFRTDLYGYNGLALPYKLWEKAPTSAYVNPHLQVICWNLLCRPTWLPNFLDASIHKNSNFDWRSDAYAVHFTFPTPHPLTSEKALRESNDTFAQIGRYVYEKAGLTL